MHSSPLRVYRSQAARPARVYINNVDPTLAGLLWVTVHNRIHPAGVAFAGWVR